MAREAQAIRAEEQRAATREKIVQAARELVGERGYDAVSTADVLARAGVSRGGLYHAFDGKVELFAAVVDALERDFIVRLADAVSDQSDPFAALRTGTQWYLDECLRSEELQRVGLLEGRKALGWEIWRKTIIPHGFAVLAQTLQAAIDYGQIRPADPTALAYLILAALHEATAIILSAPDPQAERVNTGQALANLIDGLATR
jgi:AcrR family transcriptional regulator